MIHRSTYPNPSLHTQSHTHTNTNHQTINKATHTQTIKPVGANNGHHTHHLSHRSGNPSHRSETHTANLKPRPPIKKIITGANPFKKNHHWSHHRSYQWSTQLIHPSINKSIISNPPINWSKPTINRSQPTDPNPARRSTLIQPPKSKTQGWRWSFRDERADGETEKEEREENINNERDESQRLKKKKKNLQYYYSAILHTTMQFYM